MTVRQFACYLEDSFVIAGAMVVLDVATVLATAKLNICCFCFLVFKKESLAGEKRKIYILLKNRKYTAVTHLFSILFCFYFCLVLILFVIWLGQ